MTDSKTEVALKSETALAELDIDMADLQSDAELGGKIGLKDIAIPYLYVLQTNSPQCNPDHEKYIAGATAGMLYLTVVEKIWEGRTEGITVVPCYYERLIVEWIPREAGGGMVGSYPTEDPIMSKAKPNEKGIPTLENGHNLMDTAYHYVLVKDPTENRWHQAIMPLKSTALKVSRKLNSVISTQVLKNTKGETFIAPRFLNSWKLTSVKEAKDTNVWSSPKFVLNGMVTREVYSQAKDYAKVAGNDLLRRAPEDPEMVASYPKDIDNSETEKVI